MGYSLRELAEETGISAMMLSKYERGVSRPEPHRASRLAKALRVSARFLMMG
jgi:transcriptional regulator with XRE-family HTH domain